MAERSSTPQSTSKPASDPAKPDSTVSLTAAGESGDPEVHRLLAERQAAQSNLDAVTPDETAEAKAKQAREQIEAIDKQLAKLGFSAK